MIIECVILTAVWQSCCLFGPILTGSESCMPLNTWSEAFADVSEVLSVWVNCHSLHALGFMSRASSPFQTSLPVKGIQRSYKHKPTRGCQTYHYTVSCIHHACIHPRPQTVFISSWNSNSVSSKIIEYITQVSDQQPLSVPETPNVSPANWYNYTPR